jgi:hypothetical protein
VNKMVQAVFVIVVHAVAATLLGWLYFRRYRMTRPPIGVFNLGDIAIMIGAIILVPFLYLLLPLWMVAGLLTLSSIGILYFTWEPVLHSKWVIWLVTILLASADLVTALAPGVDPAWFFAVNNLVIVLSVVGVTNLWAQSGMKARDAAILGAALAIYDVIATSLLPLTTDLFTRLVGLPFVPLLAWPLNAGGPLLGLGLGDLLLATTFPLVMRKAFGRTAGIVALIIGLGAIGLVIMRVIFGLFTGTFPVMVVLGPLMVLQYVYWRRRLAQERTTWQYLQAEPIQEPSGPVQ